MNPYQLDNYIVIILIEKHISFYYQHLGQPVTCTKPFKTNFIIIIKLKNYIYLYYISKGLVRINNNNIKINNVKSFAEW